MLGGSNSKLDFIVEKSLLEAVEKQNLAREDVKLVDICDTHPSLFGPPASELRRDMQEHWNNIRRRKIRSYKHYLGRFGVTPSATTTRLATSDTAPSDSESDSDSVEQTPKTTASVKKSSVKKASSVKINSATPGEAGSRNPLAMPAFKYYDRIGNVYHRI